MSASAPANLYTLDDYGTLTIETSGGTATPIGGVTEVEAMANVSIEELHTADSIKVADKLQHEFNVDVSIGFMFWDGTFAEQWLGGDGSTGTSMADTTTPQKYTLNGTFQSRDSSQEIDMAIEGITFESIPLMTGSNGEYTSWDLDGSGEDVTTYSVSAPA
jgi:hypothetical protein